ncbi:hypothetical protein [Kitasatospora viridis]|uniref:Uncharacterized protein n=1 Tax=Kitasatospora viridis TaxID=281105 RepID=A0A561UKL1_9ACTN|nr:hypothetical protein [Kitasatospora viridis]TWF99900.1 hypothetical protein FHX73_113760 [Kitasatospora viridis]
MSLITDLRAELGSAYLQQQVGRLARITALAAGAQLTALGTGHLDRTALTAAAVGIAETVYRQVVPVAGWGPLARALAERLHLIAPAVPAPAPAPVTLVPPVVADPAPGSAPIVDGSGPGGAA